MYLQSGVGIASYYFLLFHLFFVLFFIFHCLLLDWRFFMISFYLYWLINYTLTSYVLLLLDILFLHMLQIP